MQRGGLLGAFRDPRVVLLRDVDGLANGLGEREAPQELGEALEHEGDISNDDLLIRLYRVHDVLHVQDAVDAEVVFGQLKRQRQILGRVVLA